jgi:hypothetical protein
MCALQLNAIPSAEVLLDGRRLGPTPRMAVEAVPGTHTLMFLTDDAKKVVTIACKAGETKTVAVKLRE